MNSLFIIVIRATQKLIHKHKRDKTLDKCLINKMISQKSMGLCMESYKDSLNGNIATFDLRRFFYAKFCGMEHIRKWRI